MALNYILTCAELQKFQAQQGCLTFNTQTHCVYATFYASALQLISTSVFFFLHQWKVEGN